MFMLKRQFSFIFIKKQYSRVCFNCAVFISLNKKEINYKDKIYQNFKKRCTLLESDNYIVYVPKNTKVYYFKFNREVLFLLTVVISESLFFIERCFVKNTILVLKFNNDDEQIFCSYLKKIRKICIIIFFKYKVKSNLKKIKKILRKYITIFKQIVIYFK